MAGSFLYDHRTGQTIWSNSLYRAMRRDIELGPPSSEEGLACYSPEDAEAIRQAMGRVLHFGEEHRIRARRRLDDGSSSVIEFSMSPVYDKGEIIALRGGVTILDESPAVLGSIGLLVAAKEIA